MNNEQSDRRRLLLVGTAVVVAGIAVMAAIAVAGFGVGQSNPGRVDAVASEAVSPTSVSPLTTAGNVADTIDLLDTLEAKVDAQTENTSATSGVADVVTGAADASKQRDGTTPSQDTATQGDTTENETTQTTAIQDPATQSSDDSAGTTTAESEASTTVGTPAAADPQAPTNQGAPGTGVRELYVDGSNGSDRNPGTKDRPFRRPIEATRRAEPGTTIYFRAGTYNTSTHGTFSMRRSGTAQNWIRVAAYPGERVELVNGGENGSGFEILGASYVEVADFVIRGRSDSIHGSGVFVKDGAHDVRITNNRISGFGGAGISVINSSKITIERNEVRDNAHRSRFQGSGISIFEAAGPTASGGAYSIVIRGNYVVHNYNAVRATDGRITDGNCIILDRLNTVGYQGKTLIENNVCVENGGRGIHLFKASNALIRNNTLVRDVWSPEVESGRGELTAGHGSNISFTNNLVFNRAGVAAYINTNNQNISFTNNLVLGGPPPGEGNQLLTGDTSTYFRSTDRGGSVDQYRPLASSNLAGSANASSQSSHDLAGRKRPNTGAVGALEP